MSSEVTDPNVPGSFPPRKPRRDDLLEARLLTLGEKGQSVGLARAGSPEGEVWDYIARTRDGVPGDRVLLRVHRRRKSVVEGHVQKLLEPSPDRVSALCQHLDSCGGCAFQELSYGRQLLELRAHLRQLLEPLDLLLEEGLVRLDPLIPSERVFGYRNKMDFTFGSQRWKEVGEPEDLASDFAVGLHARGRFDKILDVRRCEIAFEGASEILATARHEALARGLSAWDVHAHVGLLRHLVLRKSFATGAVLADLVTTERSSHLVEPYMEALREQHPQIKTCVQTVNPGVALVAVGEEYVLFGSGAIEERLAGMWFRISARSFFQTNTGQAERLAALVAARAAVEPGDVLFDVYCGGGALALVVGRAAREVWGFELVPEAVLDAEHNATRNNCTHTHFVAGDVAATLAPTSLQELGAPKPDVCLVDPPRAGVHPDVLGALLTLAPRRIVYVSCNPKSALRDLPVLVQGGYRLSSIDCLDLFPHTPHLECIFRLDAR